MTGAEPATLNGGTERLRQLLRACAAGELPPSVTLAHFLVETQSVDAASRLLARLAEERRRAAGATESPIAEIAQLLSEHRDGAARVIQMLAGVHHDIVAPTPEDGVAAFRDMFDRAVERSAEGSVALHSLGSRELLKAATAEIVELLDAWGLIGESKRVLDIGCGIGRFAAALSPRVATIAGIDISGNMIAEARRRCAGLPNVAFMQTDGQNLRAFDTGSIDLVLSVDAFPYLVQSGMMLVEAHFREIARVLAPAGGVVIFNFSYRNDVDIDRADVARLAAANELRIVRNGTSDCRLWDGTSFVMISR